MADARALRDLAQEVERLSKEGDFDVECRILTTLYPQVEVMHGIALWTEGALGGTRIRVDSYTRSIDAAAALMPAGLAIKVERDPSVPSAPWRVQATRVDRPPHYVVNGHARTEALARTAAGLRAIAADLGGETDG